MKEIERYSIALSVPIATPTNPYLWTKRSDITIFRIASMYADCFVSLNFPAALIIALYGILKQYRYSAEIINVPNSGCIYSASVIPCVYTLTKLKTVTHAVEKQIVDRICIDKE